MWTVIMCFVIVIVPRHVALSGVLLSCTGRTLFVPRFDYIGISTYIGISM